MSKPASWIRSFCGGILALLGASITGWQALLIYYLIIGRVEPGEEHMPLGLAVVILLFGLLLMSAGYFISRARITGSNNNS